MHDRQDRGLTGNHGGGTPGERLPVWVSCARITADFRILPAVPATLWACLGIVAATPGEGIGGHGLRAAAVMGAGFLFHVCRPRALRFAAVLFPAALLLTVLHLQAPWLTYRQLKPDTACRADATGIVCEPSHCPDSLKAPGEARNTFVVRFRSLRTTDSETESPARGRVLVRTREPVAVRYGETVRISGVLHPPGAAVFPGAFDYAAYLRNTGIRDILEADSVQVTAAPRGWRQLRGALYDLRDAGAVLVADGIRDRELAGILAAMTFGLRDALPEGRRTRFIRSGAIHVFAISGLHVGIVVILAAGIVRVLPLPFRARFAVVPAAVGTYVLMTGASPSAVRAWLMVTVWCAGRLTDRPPATLNALAVAALVLLARNPLGLFLSGFQFSFAIVLVLAAGSRIVGRLADILREDRLWCPRSRRPKPLPFRLGRLTRGAMTASILAWLGSAGLIAAGNGLFIPAGMIVNPFLAALAFASLALAGPKILAATLGTDRLNSFLAGLLEVILRCLDTIVSTGAAGWGSVSVVRPGPILTLAYYACLGTFLALPGKHAPSRRGLALAGAAVWLGWLALRAPDPQVFVCAGPGALVPSVVVEQPYRLPPVVIVGGNGGSAALAAQVLDVRGHGVIEAAVLPRADRDEAREAELLEQKRAIREIGVPEQRSRRTKSTRLLELHRARGGGILKPRDMPGDGPEFEPARRLQAGAAGIALSEGPAGSICLEISPGGDAGTLIFVGDTGGTGILRGTLHGDPVGPIEFLPSSIPRVVIPGPEGTLAFPRANDIFSKHAGPGAGGPVAQSVRAGDS